VHEGFARELTHPLGAYLQIVFTATLLSAEYLRWDRTSRVARYTACLGLVREAAFCSES
jgi:hypothetical protein